MIQGWVLKCIGRATCVSAVFTKGNNFGDIKLFPWLIKLS